MALRNASKGRYLMVTPLILCICLAGILMVCGAYYQARAAPRLALECERSKSTISNGWSGYIRNDGKDQGADVNTHNENHVRKNGSDLVARGPMSFGSVSAVCEPIRCPPPPGGGALVRCPPLSTTSATHGVITHVTGNWSFEAKGRALPGYALFPDAFSTSAKIGKKERDRQATAVQCVVSLKASSQKNSVKPSHTGDQFEDDLAGPQLATVKKPYRARRRLYEELVKEFGNSGSRDQALLFKCAIHSRLPGFRKLIDAAFTEASREFFHIN